jgi:hypothetical protein
MTNIWVPKFKIIEAKDAILYKHRVAGFFKLEAVRPDGRRRPLTGWFPNIITDGGLNAIGTLNSWMAACRVGTGSATPSALDTNLQAHVAGTTDQRSTNATAQATPPYYQSTTRVYRFAQGAAAGNLQEIGIATAAANASGVLFSRALILDSDGNPTTITVLSDEVLDATYQIRNYPPLVDVTGTANIGGVDYDYTVRAANVTDTTNWYLPASAGGGGLNSCRFGNGAIGAITSSPSGSNVLLNATPAAYTNLSLTRRTSVTCGLDVGNFGGINWALTTFGTPGGNSSLGCMQTGFDALIPKDNTNTLTLEFGITWTRGSIT